ncbi:MAG: CvpA family protein [Verrucomicrobiota bacterium]
MRRAVNLLGVANAGSSSVWQLALLSFAAVVILFEVSRGWRLGLARQVVRLLALVAAYACAFFAGSALLPLARPLIKLPDPILSIAAGSFLAALIYASVNGLGALLFKRTALQAARPLRLFYGVTGGLLGIVFGAFFVWLAFTGVRFLGSIAQSQVRAHDETTKVPESSMERPPAPAVTPNPLVSTLAQLKASLETGAVGEGLRRADPMPARAYDTLAKLGELSVKPRAAERFLAFPGVREIGEHPKMVALRNDPAVASLIARNDMLGLLQNPRVIEALNDKSLVEKLKHFDLRGALVQSLGEH